VKLIVSFKKITIEKNVHKQEAHLHLYCFPG